MPARPTLGADLLGATRLAIDAVAGVTELVEAVHMNVLDKAIGTPVIRPVSGVTSFVYRSVKGATRIVGGGLDAVLSRLAPSLSDDSGWAGREALMAALNGVVGDRLAASGNSLAIPMQLHVRGPVTGRLLILAHGLCMNDQQWLRDGVDHGQLLARERGYTPVYLHYNSGRHVSENGRDFAQQLQALVDGWPVAVDEIAILGHSMGGLVARSACDIAATGQLAWLDKLRTMVFLGTPHHGAPLERGGNWVHLITDLSVYSAPFSRLAKLRSAGITDLRHGSVHDGDWQARDRFAHGAPLPRVPALPPQVRVCAVAASVGNEGSSNGDGLVPLASALGQHADPARCLAMDSVTVFQTNHMQLLSSPAVAARLLAWL